MNRNRMAFFTSVLFALFICAEYSYIFLVLNVFDSIAEQLGLGNNLLYYVSACLLSGLAFSVLFFSVKKLLSKQGLVQNLKQYEKILSFLLLGLIFTALSLAFIFADEDNYSYLILFPWHSSVFYIAAIVVFSALFLWKGENILLKTEHFTQNFDKSKLIWLFYLLLCLVVAFAHYRTDIFADESTIHHFDAYYQSVNRVMNLQPYSEINSGIYGFYGLILAPLVNLAGGTTSSVILIISIFSGITLLFIICTVNTFAESMWQKVSGSFIVATGWTALADIYLQHYPHRIIFPALTGFLFAYFYKRKTKRIVREFVFLSVCCAAVLWNFESGVACIVAVFAYKLVRNLRLELSFASVAVRTFADVMLSALPIMASFAAVSVYNLAVGGDVLTLKGFLFPFIKSEYMGNITLSLCTAPSVWMLVVAFLISAILYSGYQTRLFKKSDNNRIAPLVAAYAVMGAVVITYYINRPAYGNLYIIIPQIAVLLILFYNELKAYTQSRKDIFLLNKMKVLIALVLVFLSATSAVKLVSGIATECLEGDGISDYIEFQEEFSSTVSEEALCLGEGSAALYTDLGWENKYYGLDFADIEICTEEGKDYIENIIFDSDKVVLTGKALRFVAESQYCEKFLSEYTLVKSFVHNGVNFDYYIRRV